MVLPSNHIQPSTYNLASGAEDLRRSCGVNPLELADSVKLELSGQVALVVSPRHEVTWEQFVSAAPRGSIALDGYVKGRPQLLLEGPYLNFDHHFDVERSATRSTSSQVHLAIKQGMFPRLLGSGLTKFTVFVNDCDQDVCTSLWLLKNHHRFNGNGSDFRINRLLFANDMLDTTAGAYPFDINSALMREVAWVFDPYMEARCSGRLLKLDAAGHLDVIAAVGSRIDLLLEGNSRSIDLDISYDELGGGDDWRLIKERGAYGRTGLFAKGIGAYAVLVGEGSGVYHYKLGKMSPYCHFPLDDIYRALNDLEGLQTDALQTWGGSNLSGGSPREVGSKIPPPVLIALINRIVSAKTIRLQ